MANLSFQAYLETLFFHETESRVAQPSPGRNYQGSAGSGVWLGLMNTLRQVVLKAAIQGMSREKLIATLTTTLSDYSHLRNAPAAVAVLLFIRRTCLRDLGTDLDDLELRGLWQ